MVLAPSANLVLAVLYERRDTQIFYPVLCLPALALADNAFRDSAIRKPKELFSLTIPDFKEPLAIRRKPERMETPDFRRQANAAMCNSTSWEYADFNCCLSVSVFLQGILRS